jgi:hypothetical protein
VRLIGKDGAQLQRGEFDGFEGRGTYQQDEAWVHCYYGVDWVKAFVDPDARHVLVQVRYYRNTNCDPVGDAFRWWPLP